MVLQQVLMEADNADVRLSTVVAFVVLAEEESLIIL